MIAIAPAHADFPGTYQGSLKCDRTWFWLDNAESQIKIEAYRNSKHLVSLTLSDPDDIETFPSGVHLTGPAAMNLPLRQPDEGPRQFERYRVTYENNTGGDDGANAWRGTVLLTDGTEDCNAVAPVKVVNYIAPTALKLSLTCRHGMTCKGTLKRQP
jgi:hypothetical protein